MSTITSEILIIILLVIINGIFAMSEIAVVSARKVRLQQRADEGDTKAQAALALANEPNLFLSTVQIGITLVGILAGAFGGATLAEELGEVLSGVPLLEPYSQAIGLGIVVVIITYLSLVIGELVPKRLGLNNPERVASVVAQPMRILSVITSPAVYLLSLSTEAILRLLGVQPSTEPPVTEEEIRVLIEQGTQAGIFEEAEQDMVAGVFNLNDQRVSALMTPRTEIVWLDIDDPLEENISKIIDSGYSCFPVSQGSLDNVFGMVQTKDLLTKSLAGQPIDLQNSWHLPLFVPETTLASKMLTLFREAKSHIALVIDEYGGTQGLVTLNDILEAIVGDIEAGGPQAVQRSDGTWLLDGILPIDEFKEIFQIDQLPEENKGYYQTLGGFVMMYLGRIPIPADCFQWGTLRFEIMDMDGRRVDKVLITPLPESSPALVSGVQA